MNVLKGKLQAFQTRIAGKTEVLRGNRSVTECKVNQRRKGLMKPQRHQ